jgi:hypothetical protein
MVVLMFFRDDFDVGGGDGAPCGVGQREELQRFLQVGERGLDSALLLGGFSFVLKPDNIHARGSELHLNIVGLENDRQSPVSMDMWTKLSTVFFCVRRRNNNKHASGKQCPGVAMQSQLCLSESI